MTSVSLPDPVAVPRWRSAAAAAPSTRASPAPATTTACSSSSVWRRLAGLANFRLFSTLNPSRALRLESEPDRCAVDPVGWPPSPRVTGSGHRNRTRRQGRPQGRQEWLLRRLGQAGPSPASQGNRHQGPLHHDQGPAGQGAARPLSSAVRPSTGIALAPTAPAVPAATRREPARRGHRPLPLARPDLDAYAGKAGARQHPGQAQPVSSSSAWLLALGMSSSRRPGVEPRVDVGQGPQRAPAGRLTLDAQPQHLQFLQVAQRGAAEEAGR
jgi:hypothetical protein